jgi:hypothetical protein
MAEVFRQKATALAEVLNTMDAAAGQKMAARLSVILVAGARNTSS